LRNTSMRFLKDIRGNKKKYFLQSEIIDVNIKLSYLQLSVFHNQ